MTAAPTLTAAEAVAIRAPDNAVGLFTIAAQHGWSDDQIAAAYNQQNAANWTADNVLSHRGWLISTGKLAGPVASGDYLMLGGKRFNITPA